MSDRDFRIVFALVGITVMIFALFNCLSIGQGGEPMGYLAAGWIANSLLHVTGKTFGFIAREVSRD